MTIYGYAKSVSFYVLVASARGKMSYYNNAKCTELMNSMLRL